MKHYSMHDIISMIFIELEMESKYADLYLGIITMDKKGLGLLKYLKGGKLERLRLYVEDHLISECICEDSEVLHEDKQHLSYVLIYCRGLLSKPISIRPSKVDAKIELDFQGDLHDSIRTYLCDLLCEIKTKAPSPKPTDETTIGTLIDEDKQIKSRSAMISWRREEIVGTTSSSGNKVLPRLSIQSPDEFLREVLKFVDEVKPSNIPFLLTSSLNYAKSGIEYWADSLAEQCYKKVKSLLERCADEYKCLRRLLSCLESSFMAQDLESVRSYLVNSLSRIYRILARYNKADRGAYDRIEQIISNRITKLQEPKIDRQMREYMLRLAVLLKVLFEPDECIEKCGYAVSE